MMPRGVKGSAKKRVVKKTKKVEPVLLPQAEDAPVPTETAKAGYSYDPQTAEEQISYMLSQIRYYWGRIAEIAKAEQRKTSN